MKRHGDWLVWGINYSLNIFSLLELQSCFLFPVLMFGGFVTKERRDILLNKYSHIQNRTGKQAEIEN